MRRYSKEYMVISVDKDDQDDFGCFHLLATDGESWGVTRPLEPDYLPTWDEGDVVTVRLTVVEDDEGDRHAVPDWATVGAVKPVECEVAQPYESVCRWWGEEVACRHLDPTPPERETFRKRPLPKV